MPKVSSIYVCQKCGAQSPTMMGRCVECGTWGSMIEEMQDTGIRKQGTVKKSNIQILKLDEVETKTVERISTGIDEVDRVLGGGIVPGSVVLFAGEPGIGKSTLLTQIAMNLASSEQTTNNKQQTTDKNDSADDRHPELVSGSSLKKQMLNQVQHDEKKAKRYQLSAINIIYVCGEESPNQVKLRINRLGGNGGTNYFDNFYLLPETNVDAIIEKLKLQITNCKLQANNKSQNSKLDGDKNNKSTNSYILNTKSSLLVIVDSIQTLTTEDLTGVAGSIGQVREGTNRLIAFAKETHTPVFWSGILLKAGNWQDQKTIEHAVDTVLYFEGERMADLRLLRSVKNRFGPTDEVGVFQMKEEGLQEVKDLSLLYGNDNVNTANVGAARTIVFEGSRPMQVEVQALVTKSFAPIPKRVVNGLSKIEQKC